MSAVTLEEYRPEDLDELIPMWRESFEHGVGIVDWHPIEDQRAYFLGEVLPGPRAGMSRTGSSTTRGTSGRVPVLKR